MNHFVWLPTVKGNPDVIQGQDDNAQTFIDAWLARLGERAKLMVRDDRLVRCAQEHATYLAQRQGDEMQQSMHIGKNGSSANQRVRAAGYRLPDFYAAQANNVEACACHHDGPIEALQMLLDSQGHRPLVLGEKVSEWFWHRHTQWGVGNTGPFYVVVVCPPEGSM